MICTVLNFNQILQNERNIIYMSFEKITPVDINENCFKLIGSDWMLITASKKDETGNNKVNTMTASWGGMGIMWGQPVAYVVIRESRYTKEFVDANTSFSLTFFDGKYKDKLGYLGKISGRDEDKISNSGLTLDYLNETPYFSEGSLVLRCEKMYVSPMNSSEFLDSTIIDKWYGGEDYHTLYIAKITDVLLAK